MYHFVHTGAKFIELTGVVFLNPEKGQSCPSEISRGNASLGWLSNVLKFKRAKTDIQELRVNALNKKSSQAAAPSNVNMYNNIYCYACLYICHRSS